MDEERQVRGFLPPRAPGGTAPPRFEPPAASAPTAPPAAAPATAERPVFVAHQMEAGPRSGLALAGTIVGAIALLLLLLSVGFLAPLTSIISLVAILMGILARQQIIQRGSGRAGQARAAIWVGAIGLALAVVAVIVISALDVTQADLQRWLEEQLEEQRQRQREDVRS